MGEEKKRNIHTRNRFEPQRHRRLKRAHTYTYRCVQTHTHTDRIHAAYLRTTSVQSRARDSARSSRQLHFEIISRRQATRHNTMDTWQNRNCVVAACFQFQSWTLRSVESKPPPSVRVKIRAICWEITRPP
jgi:hypothetical protein